MVLTLDHKIIHAMYTYRRMLQPTRLKSNQMLEKNCICNAGIVYVGGNLKKIQVDKK